MEYNVKGGFPRISVTINKKDVKSEQGYSKYSLKTIMSLKTNKSKPLTFIPIVRNESVVESNESNGKREIKGIPIDLFTK